MPIFDALISTSCKLMVRCCVIDTSVWLNFFLTNYYELLNASRTVFCQLYSMIHVLCELLLGTLFACYESFHLYNYLYTKIFLNLVDLFSQHDLDMCILVGDSWIHFRS